MRERPPVSDWLAAERFGDRLRRALAAVGRSASARFSAALLLALLGGTCVFAWRVTAPRWYSASVTFRIAEEGALDDTAPPTTAELEGYLRAAVFTRPRCHELLRRHGLYPRRLQIDTNWAVDSLRDDIEIDVVRNTFLLEGAGDEVPPSARVQIRFRARDPRTATRVVEDLALLVRSRERAARRAWVAANTRVARRQRRQTQRQLDQLKQRQATTLVRLVRAGATNAAQERLLALRQQRSLLAARRRLATSERLVGLAELRARFERQRLGLAFELVARQPALPARLDRWAEGGLLAGVTCLAALPLIALLLGAFDTRINGEEDIRALRVTALGHLPRGQRR